MSLPWRGDGNRWYIESSKCRFYSCDGRNAVDVVGGLTAHPCYNIKVLTSQ